MELKSIWRTNGIRESATTALTQLQSRSTRLGIDACEGRPSHACEEMREARGRCGEGCVPQARGNPPATLYGAPLPRPRMLVGCDRISGAIAGAPRSGHVRLATDRASRDRLAWGIRAGAGRVMEFFSRPLATGSAVDWRGCGECARTRRVAAGAVVAVSRTLTDPHRFGPATDSDRHRAFREGLHRLPGSA